jgi:hypothetical protein
MDGIDTDNYMTFFPFLKNVCNDFAKFNQIFVWTVGPYCVHTKETDFLHGMDPLAPLTHLKIQHENILRPMQETCALFYTSST